MDTNTIILYALCAIVLVLVVMLIQMHLRLQKFFRGKDAKTLEDTLRSISTDVNKSLEAQSRIREHIGVINTKLSETVRKVETVRYNPFADSGSNQSFSTAFLNDKGDGVVLSSLYSRERVSIYAKPIVGGKSEYELTEEEESVIGKSK